jgi:hypothetical protein
MTFPHTGASYSNSGKIPPVYMERKDLESRRQIGESEKGNAEE